MGRKHKKRRTHVDEEVSEKTGGEKVPKSFVVRRGKVPALVRELIQDTRRMMLPFTAMKLREKKTNSLRDFVSISGSLGVSHLMCFSTTETVLNEHEYRSSGKPDDYAFNVQSDEKHVATIFEIRCAVLVPKRILFGRDSETGEYDLRHYVANVKPAGLTRGIRKIVRKHAIPNLARYHDISEYVTGGGGLSDSEAEDAEESKVEVLPGQRAIDGSHGARRTKQAEMAAIKLCEIGPRMRLTLQKIEEGFCDGEVLYHHHITKSPEELAALRQEMQRRRQEKAARKLQQEANVLKKARSEPSSAAAEQPVAAAREEAEVSSDDDETYYKDAVGEEPEEGTFHKKGSGERSSGKRRREDRGDPAGSGKGPGPKAGEKPGLTLQEELQRRKALRLKREKRKTKLRQRHKK